MISKRVIADAALLVGFAFTSLQCASVPSDADDPHNVAVRAMSVSKPRTDVERKVLTRIDKFQPGKPQRIDRCLVEVGHPYMAASGRVCREVRFTYPNRSEPEKRLACQDENRRGVYVPGVFAERSVGSDTP